MRIFTSRIGRRSISILLALFALSLVSGALADHGPVVIDVQSGDCGETTISASVPGGTHVSNMYLVVHSDGDTHSENIPTDESDVSITVGPFYTPSAENTTVLWRVFGGGERSYDDPHWNGFGDDDFASDINDYFNEVGNFSWVIAGPDDPNPFTTWNEVEVETCVPSTKDDCKDGGWAFPFRNQGQCIQFVNTGK